jgi:hypothetical protein
MKVISFDVGIKNMAYCIFENINGELGISGWEVLNLMDTQDTNFVCQCMNVPKSKKLLPKICTKKAKYIKNNTYYCEKHATGCSQYIVPTKQFQLTSLKKMKIEDLIKLGNKYMVFIDIASPDKMLKKDLLTIVTSYFDKRCFELIIPKKTKTASETDLIEIGRNMKQRLGEVTNLNEITNVAIENQISPIANRMKTIQGMLAQYFIMTNEDAQIDFISSANKLKQFDKNKRIPPTDKVAVAPDTSTNIVRNINPNYKSHKKDGVQYCLEVIDANPEMSMWKTALDTKKKDDLADAFLQGIWYLRTHNIIIIADDLNIKLV